MANNTTNGRPMTDAELAALNEAGTTLLDSALALALPAYPDANSWPADMRTTLLLTLAIAALANAAQAQHPEISCPDTLYGIGWGVGDILVQLSLEQRAMCLGALEDGIKASIRASPANRPQAATSEVPTRQ